MTKLLRIDEVAERVRWSKQTLYHRANGKDFPAPAKVGGLLVFDEKEVDAWIAKQFAERNARVADRQEAAA